MCAEEGSREPFLYLAGCDFSHSNVDGLPTTTVDHHNTLHLCRGCAWNLLIRIQHRRDNHFPRASPTFHRLATGLTSACSKLIRQTRNQLNATLPPDASQSNEFRVRILESAQTGPDRVVVRLLPCLLSCPHLIASSRPFPSIQDRLQQDAPPGRIESVVRSESTSHAGF